MNNYNNIAGQYQQTNVTPDKLFSILPTVMRMVGDVKGKRVLDVGCGTGFFTEAVYGLDNSSEQIRLAKANQSSGCTYVLGDMFTYVLPMVDLVLAPFVLNYAESVERLEMLLARFYAALDEGGVLVSVVDLPTGADLSRLGARKQLPQGDSDGSPLHIKLFNGGQLITTLYANYYRPGTIERLCRKVGFAQFSWLRPVIAPEGMRQYGANFWGNYLDGPELGYFEAGK